MEFTCGLINFATDFCIYTRMRKILSLLMFVMTLMTGLAQSLPANVAVILPFNLASTSIAEDKSQMRSVEFYQGLLMAVNQAQQNGQRINVLTYDLGTRSLSDILTDESLLEAQAIIAPMELNQVRQVAVFGESHSIPVISPFVLDKDSSMVKGFPHLFQLNTSKALLYDRLSETLCQQFRNFQFVFVKDSLFQTQVDPFPGYLQEVLESKGVTYHQYIYNEPYSVVCMDSALQLTNKHVFYVLETPQKDALRRFFPSLKNKLFLDANPAMAEAIGASYASGDNIASNTVTIEESIPDSLISDSVQLITEDRQIAILGYPEWQLYTNDFMEYFYDLNVWMFSKFYVNPFDFEVQNFYNEFKFWYHRDLMPKILPKYGLMGYDVTSYILNQLATYGTMKGDQPDHMPVYTLQTAISFEQTEDCCFMNKGLYLVHFTPETTIERIPIR